MHQAFVTTAPTWRGIACVFFTFLYADPGYIPSTAESFKNPAYILTVKRGFTPASLVVESKALSSTFFPWKKCRWCLLERGHLLEYGQFNTHMWPQISHC